MLPVGEVATRRTIYLRLDPTRNNQARNIKWAHDYELESVVSRLRHRGHRHASVDRLRADVWQ
jgi:hypothetical protein